MSKLSIFLLLTLCGGGLYAQAQQEKPDQVKPPAEEAKEKRANIEKAIETASKSPGAAVDPNTFQIGPEDIIFVDVWHDPDFTRAVVVRPDGKFTLPLIGEIQAAGVTPAALSKTVAEKLSTIIRDPQVSVSVTQVNSKRYYIQGEVNRPGVFPLAVPTRVLEALTNASGFKDFSNPKKIVILRNGERLKFNYKDVVKGKHMEQNIFLENGDYIIVP